MPIKNPWHALKQIYPSITEKQFMCQDDSDGSGVYVVWIDPAIEPNPENYPTPAQMEAAEIAYKDVPKSISKRQWVLALFDNNLETQWNVFFTARTPRQKHDFNYRDAIDRSYPMISAFRTAIGYTSEQMNDLFIQAKGL